MNERLYLGNMLKEREVIASAPCRLDVGGTWDLKAFALPYESISPTTTNMALSMRTKARLKPYKRNCVRISDGTITEESFIDNLRFDTRFGLLFAIFSHFNVHGVEVQLLYESPAKSGLGGSGVLAVTIIASISAALMELYDIPSPPKEKIVELAHDIEDGLRFSYTGLQDQCAAAFGGVNKWTWTYSSPAGKFEREQLLADKGYDDLEKRLVVAYIGQAHESSDVNSRQVASFLNGDTRELWFRINQIANEFASALTASDWESICGLINEETKLRIDMVPSRITPTGEALWKIADEYSAGFATAGAGNGGCVWALCREPGDAMDLKSRWAEALREVETGKVLNAGIDGDGLKVEIAQQVPEQPGFYIYKEVSPRSVLLEKKE